MKRKKKLHIDIETVSTDPGKPGRAMIAAYRIDEGPIEVIELHPAQPGSDIHRFTEEYLKQGFGMRDSMRKAFKKAKLNTETTDNNFSKVTQRV